MSGRDPRLLTDERVGWMGVQATYREQAEALRADREARQEREAALVGMLRLMEWVTQGTYCAHCLRHKQNGHASGCALAALLEAG